MTTTVLPLHLVAVDSSPAGNVALIRYVVKKQRNFFHTRRRRELTFMTYKEILDYQNKLANDYNYKPLPPNVAFKAMALYMNELPQKFTCSTQGFTPTGAYIKAVDTPIVTLNGTTLANKYERIVIGHYGAFIEISDDDINHLFIKVREGQEYRINNSKYADHVKYEWYTTHDESDCKLYFQKRTVDYADYKPGYWYISPYECF